MRTDKWVDTTQLYVRLTQCCATFLHSRHTKYCRRVMAAHQHHFAYCGGWEMVYGIDWPWQVLINRSQPKNVLFDVHNYASLLLCHLFWKKSLFIIIMRGENFVAHLDGLGGTPVCRGTPVAHLLFSIFLRKNREKYIKMLWILMERYYFRFSW
jgi:hypothetical protein